MNQLTAKRHADATQDQPTSFPDFAGLDFDGTVAGPQDEPPIDNRGSPPEQPPDGTNELPEPFFANNGGMWFRQKPKPQFERPIDNTDPAEEDDPERLKPKEASPIWVCSRFAIVAECTDADGDEWGVLIRFRDRDKREKDRTISRRLLHLTGNEIAAELEAAGLACGGSKLQHELLKRLLLDVRHADRKRHVSRCGWHTIGDSYVYAIPSGETFGRRSAEIFLQCERLDAAETTTTQGTLVEWQEKVAKLVVDNYRLGLLVCADFAGPLLAVTSDNGNGIHLFGQAASGKTTALAVAASVYGNPAPGKQLRSWRTTTNGLEAVAYEACDATMHLDELAQIDAREALDAVYTLTIGIGKSRANRLGGARAVKAWRLVLLSTGEIPLSVKVAERGGVPRAGADRRLVNIPADAGNGCGVFYELNGRSAAALATELLDASRKYYGTAARAYLERLVVERSQNLDCLLVFISRIRQRFMAANLPADANGQVVDVCSHFALFAAAGALATQWGILPWPNDNPTEAEKACANGFNAWLVSRGGPASKPAEDLKGIKQVRAWLERHSESRLALLLPKPTADQKPDDCPDLRADDARPIVNKAGYRKELADENGQKTSALYLISPEVWESEVCQGLDASRVARALLDALYLDKNPSERNLAKQHRIPGIDKKIRFYTVSSDIFSE